MSHKKLNAKQLRFVAEYLVDLNATQAAIRAGYSAKTANSIGPRLLVNVGIQAAIAEAQGERAERTHISQDRVLQELARLAFFDIRRLYNADGSLKRPDQLDDDAAAALAAIEVVEMAGGAGVAGDGSVSHVPMYTKKAKLHDKNSALTLAMRHLGMLKDKVEMTGKDGDPLRHEVTVVDETAVKAVLGKLEQEF